MCAYPHTTYSGREKETPTMMALYGYGKICPDVLILGEEVCMKLWLAQNS